MRLGVPFVLVATFALGGCASIVNGQNQSISVETRNESGPLAAANCTLSNNKGTWFVTTPGSTTVHRSYEALAVRCEKESHEPALTSVKSSTKPMAFGNILFGGLIGAGIDIGTGAAYDYPNLITVTLGGKSPASAAPAPASSGATAAPAGAAVPEAAASAAL